MTLVDRPITSAAGPQALTLGQAGISSFSTCKRQFQLRFQSRLSWPQSPGNESLSHGARRGQAFHLALERHFLGFEFDPLAWEDDQLQRWWHTFTEQKPSFPAGNRLPELQLTVPAGNGFLTGRFDLLITGEEDGRPFAHVYDWKTGRPQTVTELRASWQTRVYLALLAEGSGALREDRRQPAADRVFITYWFVNDPGRPVTIGYSQTEHARNWVEILDFMAQIERQRDLAIWPLTDDWSHCRYCPYQAFCGRQEAGAPALPSDLEETQSGLSFDELLAEPHTP